jgi:hypothetical protein
MTTFTIDQENNISAFATAEEAGAASTTPFDAFASEKDLAELIATWPADRLVAVWNSLPGVKPAKKVKDHTTAATRIWARIQDLGDTPKPEREPAKAAEPPKPKAERKDKGGAQSAKGAAAKGKASKKATPAKAAPKGKKAAKNAAGPRDGTKMAAVIALMQRKGGATIFELMEKMGWQKHTVRGIVAGALKKAGYTVESFKPEGGERTYRINR